MKSYEDAEALASQIRSGALKLELEELQSEVVGAKLGSQAIKTSIIAAIIGLLIIIAFMLIAYRIPGLAASIALLIYTGIVLAILHLYHITLTLPGIAGIILSIQCFYQPSGDYQCGKHGEYDTDCQCGSKSFYSTGSTQTKYSCCNQCSNVSVKDCGKCFLKSNVN